MQKIMMKLTAEAHIALCCSNHHLTLFAVPLEDGSFIAMMEPRNHNARFALDEFDGVHILPSHHNPDPIGDHHKHLTHVDAQPHESMRTVALRLHEAHGPCFHPDT